MEKEESTTGDFLTEASISQHFFPKWEGPLETFEEGIKRLRQPNTRFRLPPFTLDERIAFSLKDLFGRFLGALPDSYVFTPGTGELTAEWRRILRYLYEEGVLGSPFPLYDKAYNDDPKFFQLRLWARNGATDGNDDSVRGSYSRGVSFNFEEAVSKVVGELLERYPLRAYREKDLIRASIDDLERSGECFFNPLLSDHFSEMQKQRFPLRNFNRKSVFNFVKGRSLTRNCPAFVPAQKVFWSYAPAEDEPILEQPITNGAGGHFTRDEAILSGLYELIQRDAFLIYWLNEITPRKIRLDSLTDEETKRMVKSCERYGIETHVLDMTSDLGIPVFVCALVDRTGKGPALTLGGGAEPNASHAIRRAISEALGVRSWIRGQDDFSADLDNYSPFSVDFSQKERVLIWGKLKHLPKAGFLLSGDEISLGDIPDAPALSPKAELDAVLSIFADKGEEYEVFAYEARHRILDTLGYHSVSVSVPALLPLYMMETYAPLAAQRLEKVPLMLGKEARKPAYPYPHPFP